MERPYNYIDLTYLNGNYQNNLEKRNKILQMYLSSIGNELAELKELIAISNAKDIAMKAHTIKTLAIQLGIKALHDNMIFIERLAKSSESQTFDDTLIDDSIAIWNLATIEIKTILAL